MTTPPGSRYGMGRMVAPIAALASASAMGATIALAQGFQIEEATIGDIHRAIRQGETTCVQVVEAYVERARAYNGICTRLVTADGGPVAPGRGAVRAGRPPRVPLLHRAGARDSAGLRRLPRAADRVRPHGAHAVGPGRPAAVRHGRRHQGRGPAQRAEHAQPARRALGDVPGRMRRAPVGRRAARALPRRLRRVPATARRAREGGRARRPVRRESRPRPDADVLRRDLVQGTSSTPPTCGPRAGPTPPTRWTPRRATRRSWPSCAPRAPSSTPRPTSRSTTRAAGTRGAPPPARGRTARASPAAPGPARRATSTTPPASPAGRARDRRCRSARTSPPARSARRPAVRAGSRRGGTASSAS